MANAEQFGRLPLPLVEQGASFHPRALPLPLSGPCPPQITIIAAIGGPTAAAPSVAAAATVVVACSRYNESCHLAGRGGRSHLSIPPPHRRCIVRLLSRRRRRRRRRDLLLAFEMIMPSRPGDTETDRKEERKKEESHRQQSRKRENKLNEGTKRSAARQ